jgi:hypothetical protein
VAETCSSAKIKFCAVVGSITNARNM